MKQSFSNYNYENLIKINTSNLGIFLPYKQLSFFLSNPTFPTLKKEISPIYELILVVFYSYEKN